MPRVRTKRSTGPSGPEVEQHQLAPRPHGRNIVNTYNTISWKQKLMFVAATIAISVGGLHLLAGGMTHPNPDTMAARQQFIAAEYDRAGEIRDLQRGEVRVAVIAETATP